MKRPQQRPSERDLRDIKAIKRTYNKSKGTYGCKHIAGELSFTTLSISKIGKHTHF